ncbi:hypothetical protein CC2G_000955 [Coprinopsis cinerea AmutBmut pab1-1]|nr:hypothetical protein CC2G_000955 [Coprinopsis cinerea AmutBmut pab1-1]
MARFATLVTFVAAAACIPNVFAGPAPSSGPACAAQNKGLADCITKCRHKWGWNNGLLGADRWGPVVLPKSNANLEAHIASACGTTVQPRPSQAKPPTRLEQVPKNGAPIPSSYYTDAVNSRSSALPSPSSSLALPSSSSVAPSTSSESVAPTPTVAAAFVEEPEPEPTTSAPPPPAPEPTTSDPPQEPNTPAPAPARSPEPQPEPETQQPEPQPSPAPGPAPAPAASGDRQIWLDEHNRYRAEHGAAPLTWGDDLEAAALRWASGCKFEHSGGTLGRLGENLAAGTAPYPITTAVFRWVDERKDYVPGQASHFTQVVWKSTTRVGCASVVCNNLLPIFGNSPATYHVCEYDPPGNVGGRFGENVQV